MLLVRGLSLRTGMARDHRGRLVWADIAWDDSGVAGPDPYEVAIRDDWAGLARRFAGVPSLGRSLHSARVSITPARVG